MTLLIIEDCEPYAEMVKSYLSKMADTIYMAHNWEEARKFVNMEHDVIWFDLHIPGIGRDEMILRIGEMRGKFQESVIVVCSGFLDGPTHAKLEEIGVDAIADKLHTDQPEQIASLVLMGIMKAQARTGEKGKFAELLERASSFVAETFPKAAKA